MRTPKNTYRPDSIGHYVVELRRTTDLTNEQIAAKARRKFKSETKPSFVSWYVANLKRRAAA